MKRILLFFAGVWLFANLAFSQSLMHDWNTLMGTDGYMDDENLVEVLTDAAGNYYVIGMFNGTSMGFPGSEETVDLGSYTGFSMSTFIAKIAADGSPLGVGLFLGLDQVHGGQITASEIVLVGSAYDTLSVDGMGYDVKAYGESMNVMIRMDLDGNVTSVVPLTETGYNNFFHPSGAEFLPNGDFVLYGGISDTTKFNGAAAAIETDRSIPFFSRFNTNGEEVWTTHAIYQDPDNDQAASGYLGGMQIDVNGNLWFSGNAFSLHGFTMGGAMISGSMFWGPLFLKVDPADGTVLWAEKGVEPKDGMLYFSDMFATEDGGMLYTGDIFGSSAAIQGIVRSLGSVDMFEGNIIMVKFTAEGVVDWFRLLPIGFVEMEQMGKGKSREETKSGGGFGLYDQTANGDLIMAAPLGKDLYLDGISVLRDVNYGFSGIMLRIDINRGQLIWGHALHANELEAYDLEVDVNDNIWLPGSFIGNAVLDQSITLVDENSLTKKVAFISVYGGDGMLKAKRIIYPDMEANFPDISLLAVAPDPAGMGAALLGDVREMYWFGDSQVTPTQMHNRFLTHFSMQSITANSADSAILVDFYENSNGAAWRNSTNWLSGPLDTWYGVQVENSRVVGLALGNNNLSNPSSTLIGLSELKMLNLEGNNLTDISLLELSELPELRFLNLSNNDLTAFPASVFETLTLEAVNLDKNQIEGSLPATISSLTNLKSFKAAGNKISGTLPSELASLSNLISLDLSNNLIEGPLPSMTGLNSLYALDLNRNQISGALPADLTDLALLNSLGLAFNEFSGQVPDELFMLESLQILDLRGNQFDAVNPNVLGSSTIRELYLGRNAFEGEMPDAFGTLSAIEVLDLSHNAFTGKLPETFSMLYPKRVYLNDNLIDTLPDLSSWYGVMLNVQNNRLTFEFLIDLYVNGVIALAAPQSPIGEFDFKEYIQGNDYSLTVDTPGENNEYQWWKNGRIISGATSATLSITDANPADTGFYYCYLRNTDVPGLSLRTRPTVLGTKNLPMAELLQGQVTDSLGNFVESGYVYLYQDTSNVQSPRIDSVALQAEGYFNFKDFPKGKYMVKVVADKQRYPSFWPTYYPDKVSWEDGTNIVVTEDTTLNVNVTAIGVPILTSADGDGEVNGNISFEGETKGSKGKPVREATVVLIGKDFAKDGGTFVAMVTTDADGNYTITNVPDGAYSMLVDIPGLSQVSTYDVTISSNKITDKDFVITNQGIEASNTTSVEQPLMELVEFKAWPNPVADYLKIQTVDAGIKRIEIISILGQKVADEVYPSMETEITVDVSGLNPGLYFLRVHSTRGPGLKKIIVR